jgi:hypothetical protein
MACHQQRIGGVAIDCVCHGVQKGWFFLRLNESLRIDPFKECNVPVFSRVDKNIDIFVKEKWYSKIFGIFWEAVNIFQ